MNIVAQSAMQSKPFLWGPVKSALIRDAKEHGPDTILKLCYEDHERVKQMMVAVLTELGQDDRILVEGIVRRLFPQAKNPGGLKRALSMVRHTEVSFDTRTRNARRIAVEIAGNLGFDWLLEEAALHPDPATRTAAVRHTYHLWHRDRATVYGILDQISRNIMHGPVPDTAALESVLGLSLTIFLEQTQDREVLDRLQAVWRRVIDSVFGISEKSSLAGAAARGFIREQAFSLAISYMFKALREMPFSHIINYPDLETSFRRLRQDDRYRQLYQRLVSYIDVDGDYSRERMWADLETALGTRDMLIEAAFILTANAHMIRFPDESLPFVRRLLNIAEHDPRPSQYVDDLTFSVFMSAVKRPERDDLFNLVEHYMTVCQDYYVRNPLVPELHRERRGWQGAYIGSYIVLQYLRSGHARVPVVEERVNRAIDADDDQFFRFLIDQELTGMVAEHRLGPVFDIVALLLERARASAEDVTHQPLFCMIEELMITTLAKTRAISPGEVDDFLEEQQLSDEFQLQVRTNQPVETVGTLIGGGAWTFIMDDVILSAPLLRARLQGALAAATDFPNVRDWLDHILREIINVIYGREILSSRRLPKSIKQ